MASYLDSLLADRERVQQALQALIAEETAAVRQLEEQLAASTRRLDQLIVRLTVYRAVFGPGSSQALDLQTAIEDAAKPHAQLRSDLAQRQRVLQALQEALQRVAQGGRLDASAPADAPRRAPLADLLGS
jgi:chromosome segregation ATPase